LLSFTNIGDWTGLRGGLWSTPGGHDHDIKEKRKLRGIACGNGVLEMTYTRFGFRLFVDGVRQDRAAYFAMNKDNLFHVRA
jgi:hypothetical protein